MSERVTPKFSMKLPSCSTHRTVRCEEGGRAFSVECFSFCGHLATIFEFIMLEGKATNLQGKSIVSILQMRLQKP